MSDRPPLLGRRSKVLVAAGASAGLVALVASAAVPEATAEAFARRVVPALAGASDALLGWTRASAFEFLSTGLATLWLVRAGLGVRRGRRRIEAWRRILARGALRTVALVGFLFAWFTFAWGLAYDRQPLAGRHPELAADVDPEVVRRVAEAELAAAVRLRTGRLGRTLDDLEPVVRRGLAAVLEADEGVAMPDGPPAKVFLYQGRLMDSFTTSGFCSPWTLEAHVNPSVPDARLPFVLAHELAHQAGYADETEANFLAWRACLETGQPYSAYSAHLAMVLYFDGDGAYDEGRIEAADAGLAADVEASRRWYRDRRGTASAASRWLYDLYLRAEGRPDGIRSYARVVRYVVGYRQGLDRRP